MEAWFHYALVSPVMVLSQIPPALVLELEMEPVMVQVQVLVMEVVWALCQALCISL